MRLCTTLALTLMCAFAVPMSARSPAEWTLEERLAKRFNPADMDDRNQAYHAAHPGSDGGYVRYLGVGEHIVDETIDGSRDPELFMPHEVFRALLTGVKGPVWERQRAFNRAGVRQFFGDDEVFWSEVTRLALPLTTLVEPSEDERCRAQYAVLQSVRTRFGAAAFDEFLYTIVAPSMQYSATTTTAVDLEGMLRREANGCP